VKVIEIPVAQIVVGERRRTNLGDVAALARGIKRVGLLEPIIVDQLADKRYRLVAGERRRRAALILRWEKIPASLLADLTESQLREIEFEENENRKDLTDRERQKTFRASKQVVENAKKARDVLGTARKTPNSKGGRPTKESAPQQDVAEALGTSRRSLERAEQHVDLGERYPWLQSDAFRQADVLRLEKHLKRIPQDEHGELCQFMERSAAPFDPRPDRVIEYAEIMGLKTPEERAEIYQLSHSADERDQDLASTRALHRPPMPDARTTYIKEASDWLQKAVKPPYDQEPEAREFKTILEQLKQMREAIRARYERLKQEEAQRVETEVRRQQKYSA